MQGMLQHRPWISFSTKGLQVHCTVEGTLTPDVDVLKRCLFVEAF